MKNSLIRSILIVDDEEQYRALVQKFLQIEGYSCRTAASASEALQVLGTEHFDLVISDIRMDEKTGLDLVREAHEFRPDLDFIMITGHAGQYSYCDIINSGASDFILKPFSIGELKAKVERLEREKLILKDLRKTNKALESHRLHLEEMVRERTSQLSEINEQLQREIAERTQAEERIRQANEEWERTFDTVPDLIAILDTDYRIVRMNKPMVEKLGVSEHDGLGLTCYNCVHGKSKPIDLCPYSQMLEDGRQHTRELYEDRLNGYFLVTVTPFHDSDGSFIGGIHIARDITERKLMENDLRSARDELEMRVHERTAELAATNEQLKREIEERKRIEDALRESQRFLQSSVDALSAHLAILDESGTVISVNKAWKEFADSNGYKGESYGIGSNYLDVCESASGEYSEEALAVAQGIRKVISQAMDEFQQEYPCSTLDRERWFEVRVTRFKGEGPVRVVVAHEDISERKRVEQQLIHDAFHDALTGLPNRALFLDRLERAMNYARRRNDYRLAVLFLDLDRFKLINDSFGHLLGDELLVAIAKRIEGCLRTSDTVARLGGDEFSILLDDIKDNSEAVRLAERIQQELLLPFSLKGLEVFTAASIGIALNETGYDRPEELLRDADTAMYRAKAQGRARHEMFDRAMHTQVVRRLQIETDLRKALDRNEFLVHYQPVVSLRTGRIASFEALIRWQHPKLGLVSPVEFIPLAEETGLIIPIGLWVLKEACRQMRDWQRQFPEALLLKMGVNLSARQVRQQDLAEEIAKVLKECALSPTSLKLEITESVIMENAESTIGFLDKLKTMGIQLSIDDFGTGYSSLSYLHRFPVDTLKVDRSFVSNMNKGDENYEIVKTIVSLAHSLKMAVVAEGPETSEQVAQLKSLGCEYAQGYFFARPMESKAAEAFIAAKPLF